MTEHFESKDQGGERRRKKRSIMLPVMLLAILRGVSFGVHELTGRREWGRRMAEIVRLRGVRSKYTSQVRENLVAGKTYVVSVRLNVKEEDAPRIITMWLHKKEEGIVMTLDPEDHLGHYFLPFVEDHDNDGVIDRSDGRAIERDNVLPPASDKDSGESPTVGYRTQLLYQAVLERVGRKYFPEIPFLFKSTTVVR